MNKATYLPRDFTSDLVLAGRMWRRMTRAVTAQFGLAEAGASPLLWIGRMGEGIRQNTLAERIGIEGPSLVRIVDELAATGLVTRESDPSDRRANLLFLTDKGREVTAAVEVEINDLRERVLGGLDSADIAAAARIFAAIKTAGGQVPSQTLELAD